MRFVLLSILTRVQGTVSPVVGELSVVSLFECGVMAWTDGLVLAGAAGGTTDGGWLPPDWGPCPMLHPVPSTTAKSPAGASDLHFPMPRSYA